MNSHPLFCPNPACPSRGVQNAGNLRVHQSGESAGRRVGYDDAAHFNREYKGIFGQSPLRDRTRLREAAKAGVGA